MGLTDPPVRESKPFQDVIGYGTPFILDGIRTVEANSTEFGKGEMVLIEARGHTEELSVWGRYLTTQANAATPNDFGQWYKLVEGHHVPAFSKRPVKALVPCPPGGEEPPDF